MKVYCYDGTKKRDMKVGAKAKGISFTEFKADIQYTIDEGINSTDPEAQARFKKTLETSDLQQKNTFML